MRPIGSAQMQFDPIGSLPQGARSQGPSRGGTRSNDLGRRPSAPHPGSAPPGASAAGCPNGVHHYGFATCPSRPPSCHVPCQRCLSGHRTLWCTAGTTTTSSREQSSYTLKLADCVGTSKRGDALKNQSRHKQHVHAEQRMTIEIPMQKALHSAADQRWTHPPMLGQIRGRERLQDEEKNSRHSPPRAHQTRMLHSFPQADAISGNHHIWGPISRKTRIHYAWDTSIQSLVTPRRILRSLPSQDLQKQPPGYSQRDQAGKTTAPARII